MSGNNRYAFVLFEALPEHDLLDLEALALVVLVDFAVFALVALFDFAEALVELFALFMVFLPTEPQAEHFLLLDEVLFAELLADFEALLGLLALFLVLPNIVFTSRLSCKKRISCPMYFVPILTKNTKFLI